MNEWSPGGYYSCPATSNQSGRSHRIQQDESLKGSKHLIVNMRTPESRSRSFQQYSVEDVSRGISSPGSKKGGICTSDPRFKRVVPAGVQNDACVGTDGKNAKPSVVTAVKETPMSRFPIWNAPEFIPNKTWVECIKNPDNSKSKPKDCCESLTAGGDSNIDKSQDNLKAVDKLAFNHDIVIDSVCKESVSECTMNTRNTSLASEEIPQEYSDTLGRVPTATQIKKVENWIQDQGPRLEKKHSVVTVIGQMQEPDTLSSALQEIDKRRKLVKELDKFAVCKKIVEAEKETEVPDLINKLDSLQRKESVLFSASFESLYTVSNSARQCGDKLNKQSDTSNTENSLSNFNAASSIPLSRKSSTKKRLTKKQSSSQGSCPGKGKLQMLVSIVPYQRVFCMLILMSGILSWFAFSSLQKGYYVSFDLFGSKPKPLTWYERLFSWIWEFFRPSNNYHRTTQWTSY